MNTKDEHTATALLGLTKLPWKLFHGCSLFEFKAKDNKVEESSPPTSPSRKRQPENQCNTENCTKKYKNGKKY